MSLKLPLPVNSRLLLLLRHGEARKDLPVRDRERPLAPEGREDIARVARRLQRHGLLPEQILCSPAKRARETAELFRTTAGVVADCQALEELYEGHADEYLRLLRSLSLPPAALLLVGHNPAISDLFFLLCPDAGNRLSSLPAGGGVVLAVTGGDWGVLAADTVHYVGMLLPRDRESL